MSWTKSAGGTGEEILNAAANWPGEIDAVDKTYGAGDELRAGHRRQANAALGAIQEFLQELPADRKLSVSAYGHANTDGTGNITVSIQEFIATPAVEGANNNVGAQNGNGKHPETDAGESREEIPDAAAAAGVAEQVEGAKGEGEGPTNPEDLAPVGG